MNTNRCAHDRFDENDQHEAVCAICGLPWKEAVREWKANMDVKLKHPRGCLSTCKVYYEYNEGDDGFRAWLYMGGCHVLYEEHLFVSRGSWYVETCLVFAEEPRYMPAGLLEVEGYIDTFSDWKSWLEEYASELDPRDAFRRWWNAVKARPSISIIQ